MNEDTLRALLATTRRELGDAEAALEGAARVHGEAVSALDEKTAEEARAQAAHDAARAQELGLSGGTAWELQRVAEVRASCRRAAVEASEARAHCDAVVARSQQALANAREVLARALERRRVLEERIAAVQHEAARRREARDE